MNDFDESGSISPVYAALATQHDGLGGLGISRLLEAFGTPEGIYDAGPEAWKQALPRLQSATISSMQKGPDLRRWNAIAARCHELGITVAAPGSADYPEPIRALPAPPPLLFLRGRWLPEDARAVALVGTRGPTDYGRRAAATLARDFAEAGYCTVSGLAVGIDGAAHHGALEGGGRTIAVIGCGLDIPYPLENLPVRARIEEDGCAHGLIVSEFPPGTAAHPAHFPRRNRLISALAQAVVVVEAGSRSGALITAARAREQGRPIFSVPGPIFSDVSAGTTALLRRGALPAASVHDVIRVLEGDAPARRIPLPAGAEELPEDRAVAKPRPGLAKKASRKSHGKTARASGKEMVEDPVVSLWENEDACGLDALAARAVTRGLWLAEEAHGALLERLLHLELQGRVRRLPGAIYRRV
jgi:DNA processing protein